MERDGVVRNRLELDRSGQRGDLVLNVALTRILGIHAGNQGLPRADALLNCTHSAGGYGRGRRAFGDLHLLSRGLVAWVNLQGPRELVDRAGDIAGLAQDTATIHMEIGCGIADTLVALTKAQILWIF